MIRILSLFVLGTLFLFALVVPQSAQAICKWVDSVDVSTDYQLGWPVYTNWYDPCDSWITWAFIFTRTSQGAPYNTVNMGIEGTNIVAAYPAGDYPPGNYEYSNTVYCGPSTAHRIFMNKFNANISGHFLNLKARAIYSAGNDS